MKFQRISAARQLPFFDLHGNPFTVQFADEVLELFHRIDSAAAGSIVSEDKGMLPEQQDRYLVRSLMEEAISSSQLEGAATTRRVAKEMIRSGRPPRNTSERMILNNYHAMNRVRQLQGEGLTIDLPLPGAQVALRSVELGEEVAAWMAAGMVPPVELVTDGQGRLAVDGLPNGSYAFAVGFGGEPLLSGELAVPPAASAQVALALP